MSRQELVFAHPANASAYEFGVSDAWLRMFGFELREGDEIVLSNAMVRVYRPTPTEGA